MPLNRIPLLCAGIATLATGFLSGAPAQTVPVKLARQLHYHDGQIVFGCLRDL